MPIRTRITNTGDGDPAFAVRVKRDRSRRSGHAHAMNSQDYAEQQHPKLLRYALDDARRSLGLLMERLPAGGNRNLVELALKILEKVEL